MTDTRSSLSSTGDVQAEARRYADTLRTFVREFLPGGCKMLSQGPNCVCPLCAIDNLERLLAAQEAAPSARAEAKALRDAADAVMRQPPEWRPGGGSIAFWLRERADEIDQEGSPR